jgi:hypothetical protein
LGSKPTTRTCLAADTAKVYRGHWIPCRHNAFAAATGKRGVNETGDA